MFIVELEDAADRRYRRCLANGFTQDETRTYNDPRTGNEVEVYVKPNGSNSVTYVDFGDLPVIED